MTLVSSKPRPPGSTLFPYTTLFRSEPPSAPAIGAWSASFLPKACCWPAWEAFWDSCSALGACAPCCWWLRSEEHTSELQSRFDLVCRLLLEKKECVARYLL